MDVETIKEYLYKNTEDIVTILEELGFTNITEDNYEFRCAKEEGANSTSVRVKKNRNITANIFSEGISGDIITLISEWKGLGFRETLKYICDLLGLHGLESKRKDIVLPFGGFAKRFNSNKVDSEPNMKIMDESILRRFDDRPNIMFLKDNISIKTQEKFSIMYDHISDRVVIPWHDTKGNLVGIMGRVYDDNYDGDFKYIPLIEGFAKTRVVYGYSQNYNFIKKHRVVFIGEAEKFVMQLDSMGLKNGLGLGGNEINDTRATIINSLRADVIILAFDEGLSEKHISNMAKMLIMDNVFYKNKVGYIYDRDNKYMKKDSHVAPSDLGIDIFQKLVNECVVWVN